MLVFDEIILRNFPFEIFFVYFGSNFRYPYPARPCGKGDPICINQMNTIFKNNLGFQEAQLQRNLKIINLRIDKPMIF